MPENIESLNNKIAELQKEVERLKLSIKKKKFGLTWIEVPEVFDDEENKLPILREVSNKSVVNDDGKPTHILIEGDNYHALTCLNYTHKRKIDVIYIDPPYNTGAKDWKYNNNYVDDNDPWRHSKWINFMANRLRIAKNLLKGNGVLICTIDENEQAPLCLLLEEIFPNHKIVCVTIIHNPGGIQGKNFSYCHEYALFVYPDDGKRYIELENRIENSDIRPLRDVSTGDHLRVDAANCFYPIFVKDCKIIGFGDVCDDSFHPNSANVIRKDGVMEIYPIDPQGNERKWVFARNTVESIVDELEVKFIERRKVWDIIRTKTQFNYKTVWTNKKYNANISGTKLLRKIVKTEFPFPKSLYNTKDCLTAVAKSKKNAIIFDYFAGSGTTAHAVMEMNKEDGGNRQCIVCTNNENNICQDVTYPRIKRVINGYPFKGIERVTIYEKKLTITTFKKASDFLSEMAFVKEGEKERFDSFETKIEDGNIKLFGIKKLNEQKEGLGGSLKYYKTAFIGDNNILNATDKDKVELAHQAGGLLSIAENTLYKVEENDFWQVYENDDRYTSVYFREELDKFEEFISKVEKLEWPVTVYVFSWGDEEFIEEFDHIEEVKVKTIPLPILEIYKSIYNLG